jgi:hypothetical protein
MLDWLQSKYQLGDRRARLFAVASCRCIWARLTDERSKNAVVVAERFADGDASVAELSKARTEAEAAKNAASKEDWPIARAAAACAFENSAGGAFFTVRALSFGDNRVALASTQASALREIVGPSPFRPVSISPSLLKWNDATVVKLARTIYDERSFDGMGVLADALEEAGCTEPDILAHCRQAGNHVRGCWVVDLLLGKG